MKALLKKLGKARDGTAGIDIITRCNVAAREDDLTMNAGPIVNTYIWHMNKHI